jgi:hypothetical protein
MPCRMRAATNIGRLCARPQATEASVKMRIAPANTWRGPNRSATQPLTGMNTASASR